jgi:hypothetical protein
MIPAVKGLLPELYNSQLITLLFRLAEWHALAKLRMQTEHTLNCLNQSTVIIGQELWSFREWSRGFNTVELPREMAAHERRKNKKTTSHTGSEKKALVQPKVKLFNLLIYKLHALGDYVQMIKLFGTTDSYSTPIVSLKFHLFCLESS